ncbi:MAG: LL-diaminopimelate aminotransferase [Clostridiales bacterium]|nr:LL-diaminopimelate aminotransferase [Clostridiales bacterium]
MKINKNYLNLKENYLFLTISNKVKEYKKENPKKKLINLGIGDVTLPLPKAVIKAMHKATDEMSNKTTFRGYGTERGYTFLRDTIVDYYNKKNVFLNNEEVFISDGAKSDLGNILDIFSKDNKVLIPDPVYPVYVDTNVMDGREIIYVNNNIENNFLSMPDQNLKCDIIYMCSPNNPTGNVYNKDELKIWIEYAKENRAILLFDSAYEGFIQEKYLPSSIYQIEGAKECAIEFGSLSKTAGFTGVRCGYTIIPHEISYNNISLNDLWLRRQTTKFNGVSYITQRGAEAVFTEDGLKQTKENISYYMKNAKIISDVLTKLDIWHTGGENSPYIWFKCPKNMNSWIFFDYLLKNANVIGTPGAGFGSNGKNFFRFSAFCDEESVVEALNKIKNIKIDA